MRMLPILLGAVVLLGAGCAGSSSKPASSTDAANSESRVSSEDAARFQRANVALVTLLRDLASRQKSTEDLQQRIGRATYQSLSNMKQAADEMEAIVKDANDRLSQ